MSWWTMAAAEPFEQHSATVERSSMVYRSWPWSDQWSLFEMPQRDAPTHLRLPVKQARTLTLIVLAETSVACADEDGRVSER